eukprot:2370439-Pleurochrysis_carterae.AAC.1
MRVARVVSKSLTWLFGDLNGKKRLGGVCPLGHVAQCVEIHVGARSGHDEGAVARVGRGGPLGRAGDGERPRRLEHTSRVLPRERGRRAEMRHETRN